MIDSREVTLNKHLVFPTGVYFIRNQIQNLSSEILLYFRLDCQPFCDMYSLVLQDIPNRRL